MIKFLALENRNTVPRNQILTMIFPSVLALINGVMKPTVTATAAMVTGSNNAVAVLLKEKEKAIRETDLWKTGRCSNDDSSYQCDRCCSETRRYHLRRSANQIFALV